MKAKELKNLPAEELEGKLAELKKELMKHNAQVALGAALKSPGKVKQTKKTIARILTIKKTKEVK